ncbi:MAG TPA: hypothetical protein VF230_11285 [Acidimicrobiales bacterium]
MAKAMRLLFLVAVAFAACLAAATPATAAPKEGRGNGADHLDGDHGRHGDRGVRAHGDPHGAGRGEAPPAATEPQPDATAPAQPSPEPASAATATTATTATASTVASEPASGPRVQAASDHDRREAAQGTTGTTVVVPGPKPGQSIVRGDDAEALGPAQHIEAAPVSRAASSASGPSVLGEQHVRPPEQASAATGDLARTGLPFAEPVGLAGGLIAIGTALTSGASRKRSRRSRRAGRRQPRRPARVVSNELQRPVVGCRNRPSPNENLGAFRAIYGTERAQNRLPR